MNFFDIKKSELQKISLMGLLIFLIFFNQNITRGLKDSLLLSLVGAEIISFVKIFVEIPVGILFAIFYTKLSNHISTEVIFKIIVGIFIFYFGIFAIYLFPNYKTLQLINIPILDNFKWITMLYKNWVIVIFYVAAEMWPIIICLFFWQLANRITTSEDAFRFYPIWTLIGQTSLIISGFILNYLAGFFSLNQDTTINNIPNIQKVSLELSSLVNCLILIVFITGIIIILLQSYIVSISYKKHNMKKIIFNLDIKNSIKIILSSRYLGLICIICISYHACINLIESIWFFQAKKYYPNAQDFMQYQGNVLFYTGIFTLILSLFSGKIIKSLGWLISAAMTPLALFFSGIIFFSIVILEYLNSKFNLNLNISSNIYYYIIIFGAIQNIIGKGTKYSLYDSTKEMLYIKLEEELRTKGKVAVDIVGSKLGRFLGVIMQTTLFSIYPTASYTDISIYLFLAYIFSCLCWFYAIFNINKKLIFN
ncbi:MAG: Npt1/Npt2 family nucleotide transporter [Rickettsiales bacterium]